MVYIDDISVPFLLIMLLHIPKEKEHSAIIIVLSTNGVFINKFYQIYKIIYIRFSIRKQEDRATGGTAQYWVKAW